jgi:hypothetical protein
VDSDGDGLSPDEGDCDDTSAAIYPGAEEICGDEVDQDCDDQDPVCPAGGDDNGGSSGGGGGGGGCFIGSLE